MNRNYCLKGIIYENYEMCVVKLAALQAANSKITVL